MKKKVTYVVLLFLFSSMMNHLSFAEIADQNNNDISEIKPSESNTEIEQQDKLSNNKNENDLNNEQDSSLDTSISDSEVHNQEEDPILEEKPLLEEAIQSEEFSRVPNQRLDPSIPLEYSPLNTLITHEGNAVDNSDLNLPENTVVLEFNDNTRMLLNGMPLDYETEIKIGDIYRFENVGEYKGKKLIVEWTVESRNEAPNRYFDMSIYPVGHEMPSEGIITKLFRNQQIKYSQKVYDMLGNELDIYCLIPYKITENFYLEFNKDDILRTFSLPDNLYSYEETPTTFTLRRNTVGGREEIYLLTKPNMSWSVTASPEMEAPPEELGQIGGYGIVQTFEHSFFTPAPYEKLTITGGINTPNMKAEYTVGQVLPQQTSKNLYLNGYEMNLKVDEILKLSANDVEKLEIKNDKGENMTAHFTLTLGTEHNIIIATTKEQLQTMEYQNLSIDLILDVDAYSEKVTDYLSGDSLIIPINGSHSQNFESVTANATVKYAAVPSGEGIPTTVSIGSSTDDLILPELVGKLTSSFPNDTITVVGVVERKEFLALGETTIEVTIKSKLSSIEVTVQVPITVIQGELTLEEAPLQIVFKDLKIKTVPKDYYPLPMTESLKIKDTRYQKQKWTLKVAMSESLHYGTTQEPLDGGIMYQFEDGTSKELSESPIDIAIHTNIDNTNYDVSAGWFEQTVWKNGFYLHVKPGNVKAGQYKGSMKWTLADVPANE
ncbi:WxL domain-containing protein [Isobaculum melis]|uniref:WxL domain surface cell wall-binding n=1 Tax=Isobaculum melis TaxID=142588 RepID=A0A1H9SQG3_9LACT|nr:WxL domain-containing protein [Isobaculum melis]SER87206.1 WxL domain surface cell wall-binding [Isobaculum melis]